jgi:pimeloyl-ACP methyl ester carboxylesterase
VIDLGTWERGGRRLATPDGNVFHQRFGDGPGTPLLLLHGFPTSSHDFADVVPALARERPVIAFDFLGFGLSDKPRGFAYSLFEQTDVACAVAREHGLERAHVVAHDMGTSVLTELLARRERGALPFEIASVTFSNGSVHSEMAHLTPAQKILRTPLGGVFARLGTRRTFELQIRRVFARQPAPAVVDAMFELVDRDQGARNFPEIIRYVDDRKRFARRWIGALERLDLPALVAWGERDPVAVLAIGDRLAREIPRARRVTWPELGHYPQVEDPAAFTAALTPFLALHEPA